MKIPIGTKAIWIGGIENTPKGWRKMTKKEIKMMFKKGVNNIFLIRIPVIKK